MTQPTVSKHWRTIVGQSTRSRANPPGQALYKVKWSKYNFNQKKHLHSTIKSEDTEVLGGLRARPNEIKARSSRSTWKNCSLWLRNVHCWNARGRHDWMNSYSISWWSLLLINRPREDERLSWPWWLTYSGRFTHINGYPSAAGPVQTSESSPVRDRRSTTEPPNQLMMVDSSRSSFYLVKDLLFIITTDIYSGE